MELTLTDTETLTILETSGARLVAEVSYAPGRRRPPLHLHPGQDEHFDVLEGAIDVQLGGESRRVAAGQSALVEGPVMAVLAALPVSRRTGG